MKIPNKLKITVINAVRLSYCFESSCRLCHNIIVQEPEWLNYWFKTTFIRYLHPDKVTASDIHYVLYSIFKPLREYDYALNMNTLSWC